MKIKTLYRNVEKIAQEHFLFPKLSKINNEYVIVLLSPAKKYDDNLKKAQKKIYSYLMKYNSMCVFDYKHDQYDTWKKFVNFIKL